MARATRAVPARVDFVAEAEICSSCGAALEVCKSRTRTVATLTTGTFTAREVLKQCTREHSGCPVEGSRALAGVVKTRQRHGYDLIVQVGVARYLNGKQREEIRAELRRERGIEISAGTVSALCDRFLLYFAALHAQRAGALRAAMGSYPLHLDATCEYGKGGLFICMNGWRQWVLVAGRIPSEHVDHLEPLVQKTVGLFGEPVATVRDMGEAGAGAVKFLGERGIPDFICHYHFLAAVGTKLFDEPYALLRRLVQSSGLRTELHAMLRTLRRYGDPRQQAKEDRFGTGRVRENLLALVLWILAGTGKKDLCFPFSLPHLEFVRRCHQALACAERWVAAPRTEPERRTIRHLEVLLARLDREARLPATVQLLENRWLAFSELRDVLVLTNAELPGAERSSQQKTLAALEFCRLEEIAAAVKRYRTDLNRRAAALTAEQRKNSCDDVILRYFKRYGAYLFGHPVRRDEDGVIVAIVERTNNVAEQFFGHTKQQLRRRLGRAHLGRDLAQQPAQAALVQNLRHADYVSVLCGSLENLPACFASLDADSTPRSTALTRDHRDSKLFRSIRDLLDQSSEASGTIAANPAQIAPAATVV